MGMRAHHLVRGSVAVAAAVTVAAGSMLVAGCGGTDGASTTSPSVDTSPGGGASGARVYSDPSGDVPVGTPDLTQVRIANDATTLHLAFQFASAPPLATNTAEKWTDMLLMGIDVPPIGPGPTPSGWPGLDYALGMHGAGTGARFRAMAGATTPGTRPELHTPQSTVRGRTITIDLPLAWMKNPKYFEFNVAVGREGEDEASSAGGDSIPATGTARYTVRR